MPDTFTTTGGTQHSSTVTGLVNGANYNLEVRCQGANGGTNTDDYAITFSVAQPGDTTPPVRSNGLPTGTLNSGTTQATLSLTTDENATCRYATMPGVAYSAMSNTFTPTGGLTMRSTVGSYGGRQRVQLLCALSGCQRECER